MSELNIYDILENIPHRYPFILVDKVLDLVPGERIHAIKNVTVNEPFFAGHYPNKPIMPGVMILEALAQAGALIFSSLIDIKLGSGNIPLFVGIDNARFKQPVIPGDQLHLHVEVTKSRNVFWKMSAIARVDGTIVCSAELTSATTQRNQKSE